ncbi:MAG: hypothetical protein C0501_10915 [Isosphaera sp.]|nr:hypothetical protein [Isosphaera sp.]
MLTPRGTWFLVVSGIVLAVGALVVPLYSVVPVLLALALLAWFAAEWVAFQTRSCAAVSRLTVTRTVLQGGREVPMVWAGLAFEVRVTVRNPSTFDIPFAVVEDRPAVATDRARGAGRRFVRIPAGGEVELTHTVTAPSLGVLRFEGVQVRVADPNGFFLRRVFLRDPAEYLVLPPLTDDEGRQRATKRFNTLPPPGAHRLRLPGSGSELLDLRDYRPGDPPKTIAWKASARRDRLITKEFENDVPVRTVLFLDTTDGVRLGPPGNTLLTRMAAVAAGVAQSAAANRDLVGLTTFDERGAAGASPARTKLHMIGVLRRLAEASALQPGADGVPAEVLTARAYPLARELYPELMDKRANAMPLSRLWLPLLDRRFGWLVPVMVIVGVLLFYLGLRSLYLGVFRPEAFADRGAWDTQALLGARQWLLRALNFAASLTPASWPFLLKVGWLLLMLAVTFFPPATLGLIFWFFFGARGWFGERRRELTERKQLAALFALLDRAGPDPIERYVADDRAYAARAAAFLQQHLLRCPVPLYDETGRYRYRCPGKAAVLAGALVRAVGRARDNELYVVFADLAELGPDLAPVVRACRAARARHHHLLVIVPWPADVPPPDEADGPPVVATPDEDDRPTRGPRARPRRPEGGLARLVRESLTRQYHEAFRALRRELGRAGATVMRVSDGDPVRVVLDRLDRLRGLRTRR